jgi:hypothetical protein
MTKAMVVRMTFTDMLIVTNTARARRTDGHSRDRGDSDSEHAVNSDALDRPPAQGRGRERPHR